MAVYQMPLGPTAYDKARLARKGIDFRLNDPGLDAVVPKDIISFSVAPHFMIQFVVGVVEVARYPTFRELLSHFQQAGHLESDQTLESQIQVLEDYFTEEDIGRHGVIGFRFKVIAG